MRTTSCRRSAMLRSEAAGKARLKPHRLSASVVIAAKTTALPQSHSLSQRGVPCDYKICMLQRAAKSTFMPDVMVFPGGAVDAADAAVTNAVVDRSDIGSVTSFAACREAFEESGIVIANGTVPKLSESTLAQWRSRVQRSPESFADFFAWAQLQPDFSRLTQLCSFITPDAEHARLSKGGFHTQFYLHCVEDPSALVHATSDLSETSRLVWLSPNEALDASEAGEIFLAPPQWYILHNLAGCLELAKLTEHVATAPGTQLAIKYPIKPYPADLDVLDIEAGFSRALCYPGDEAHPIYAGPPLARHRMVMSGKFGAKMKYGLRRTDELIKLPLKEAVTGWYEVAQL